MSRNRKKRAKSKPAKDSHVPAASRVPRIHVWLVYLGLAVYFAHPYSSWERGTNENTNGVLRQYLPKSRNFSTLTTDELARYIWQLNNRPRKCLSYRTPAEVFHRRGVALGM